MAVQKRAINPADKLKRKEKILKTAWQLYKKKDGRLPTVSVIAQASGLSKGSVYLYFKTKNEIFLYLYMHQLRQWHEAVVAQLKNRPNPISIQEYAEITTDYVIKNPLLLKMGSIVTGVLEQNMEEQVILDVKTQIAGILDDRSQLTCKLFSGLTFGQWVNVHLRIYALIFGLWQMFYNPPNIHRLLQKAEINIFESDFSESVVKSVATFLKGALPME